MAKKILREDEEIENIPEETLAPQTPIPSTYSLFEDKPYLQILREKIKQFRELRESVTTLIEKELEFKKNELEKTITSYLYNLAGSLVADGYLDKSFISKLKKASNFDDFRNVYNEIVNELKKKGVLNEVFKKYNGELRYLVDLYVEYNHVVLAINDLQKKKEIYELYEKVYSKFLDMLEIYPKHLRMGVLNEFEVKAIRFITDTYFTIFARGLIFDDLKSLQEAFFIIAPYIINIQETSLSKEGFFLRLVASSPLIQQMPPIIPEEENTEELINLIKTESKVEAEKNVRQDVIAEVMGKNKK